MMDKKFVTSVGIVFAVSFLLGWLIHGGILVSSYQQFSHLYRPEVEMKAKMLFMVVAHLIYAGALNWVYLRGREGKPFLGQGIRFGLAVAALVFIPNYIVSYVVMPVSCALVAKQVILDSMGATALGVLVAWLNR